jgi:hypothetical protein
VDEKGAFSESTDLEPTGTIGLHFEGLRQSPRNDSNGRCDTLSGVRSNKAPHRPWSRQKQLHQFSRRSPLAKAHAVPVSLAPDCERNTAEVFESKTPRTVADGARCEREVAAMCVQVPTDRDCRFSGATAQQERRALLTFECRQAALCCSSERDGGAGNRSTLCVSNDSEQSKASMATRAHGER